MINHRLGSDIIDAALSTMNGRNRHTTGAKEGGWGEGREKGESNVSRSPAPGPTNETKTLLSFYNIIFQQINWVSMTNTV